MCPGKGSLLLRIDLCLPSLNNCIIFSCVAVLWFVDHFLQEETVTQICEGLAQMEAEKAGTLGDLKWQSPRKARVVW